jgi:hypothetical protein
MRAAAAQSNVNANANGNGNATLNSNANPHVNVNASVRGNENVDPLSLSHIAPLSASRSRQPSARGILTGGLTSAGPNAVSGESSISALLAAAQVRVVIWFSMMATMSSDYFQIIIHFTTHLTRDIISCRIAAIVVLCIDKYETIVSPSLPRLTILSASALSVAHRMRRGRALVRLMHRHALPMGLPVVL